MTSSTVMTPTSLFSASTTGNRQQVVRGDLPRHFFLVGVDARALDVGGHDALQRRIGGHQQQPSQRRDADEVPPLVDDVEVEHHLDVARRLNGGDRLAGGQFLREREHIGIHQTAGGLLFVFEQVADAAAGLRPNQLEHHRAQVGSQPFEQRRRIVGRDFLNELGDLLGRSPRQELGALLGAELAQRFHAEPAVLLDDDVERGVALAFGKLGKDLGQIGGMLFLEQVQEIGGRAHAQQSAHRLDDRDRFCVGLASLGCIRSPVISEFATTLSPGSYLTASTSTCPSRRAT